MPSRSATRKALAGVLAAMLILPGCGGGGAEMANGGGDDAPLVVATTTHLADFARVVGGDRARVYQVLRPGVSPHEHEPTAADLEAVAGAEVVVHNGLGLEAFWPDLVSAAGPEGIVVDASEGIATLGPGAGEAHPGTAGHGEVDPHVWHDPTRASVMVANLTDALARADPGEAEGYRARARRYLAELSRLDAEIRRRLSGLASRKVVTNHEAFGYYVDRYGLQFVGAIIPSFDSSAELAVDDVRRMVALIRAERVRAVFAESDVPPKTAEAIAEEAGVRVVAGPDGLYGDSLGAPGSGAETYLDMMRHNTSVIVANLG